jgi:hypothetical protein
MRDCPNSYGLACVCCQSALQTKALREVSDPGLSKSNDAVLPAEDLRTPFAFEAVFNPPACLLECTTLTPAMVSFTTIVGISCPGASGMVVT